MSRTVLGCMVFRFHSVVSMRAWLHHVVLACIELTIECSMNVCQDSSFEDLGFKKQVTCSSLLGLAMALTIEVKNEAESILQSTEVSNIKIDHLNKLWLQRGPASYQKLQPQVFLVHPSNRGGAMLNGHDVVAKGLRVMAQGLRKDLLETSAVAFATGPDVGTRKKQLAANAKLANQFHSSVASPQGNEMFVTVGCSHTAAFLRSLQFGLQKLCYEASWPSNPRMLARRVAMVDFVRIA